MTTDDRDWIREGAKVAVYTRDRTISNALFRTIERVTKTQIVLADGSRFNRDTLQSVGERRVTWPTKSTQLRPVDDPDVIGARAQARLRQVVSIAQKATEANLKGGRDGALAALTAIENAARLHKNAIEAQARAAITGKEA